MPEAYPVMARLSLIAVVFWCGALACVPAHGATLIVKLPATAAIRVYDRDHPDAPSIDCPGTCRYETTGAALGLNAVKVDVLADPRTGDPPWDIVAINGCRGTSALPADNANCYLPTTGDATVSFDLAYRPVVAVKAGGSVGGPLAALYISAGPGAENAGIVGHACNVRDQNQKTCAKHQHKGAAIALSVGQGDRAALDSVSAPCGSAACTFTVESDTCVAYLYHNANPLLFPTIDLIPVDCPTGPGIEGPGGGGGGDGPPPPGFDPLKQLALDTMRAEVAQSYAPCLTAGTSLALFAVGPIGAATGQLVFTPAALICARIVQHLTELQRVYDDPPDPAFHTLARLRKTDVPSVDPSVCASLTGSDRKICRKLAHAAQRHVKALYRVGDVAVVWRTTVERASAAYAADEQRQFKRQLRAATKRAKQLTAAIAARAKAGKKIVAILRAANVTGTLSETQFTDASAIVLSNLANAGLPESDARALLGTALTPRAIDLLEILSQ